MRFLIPLLLLLASCAGGGHSCYVGVSLIPPSPVIMCGVDLTPPEKPEEGE